jgi:hypothetical protein
MANEKMTEVIVDALTNQVTVLELSAERIAEIEADRALTSEIEEARAGR